MHKTSSSFEMTFGLLDECFYYKYHLGILGAKQGALLNQVTYRQKESLNNSPMLWVLQQPEQLTEDVSDCC